MPKALILYHYFYPDDVSSARHLSDLAQGLVKRGWELVAMPCHRGCRDEGKTYPHKQEWEGIHVRRVWRPNFRQSSSLGRLFNASWMIFRWSLAALSPSPPDVVIVGTDPILSVLVARFWKMVRPRTRIVHWCFDLYPEAAVADGILKPQGKLHRCLQSVLRPAYRRCDLIVDIGSCMRERLSAYSPSSRSVTLTPWALVEPDRPVEPDPEERRCLFGGAAVGLIYSGTLGRAHAYEEILQLARFLQPNNVKLVFSVRGNREQKLREAVGTRDTNISFCDFAADDYLERRLGAADIHLVSLRPEWTGTVVPSKFFGAIAAGRPVLFVGSRDSAIAKWIESFGLGWVLNANNIAQVGDEITRHMSNPEERVRMRWHCFETYRRYFSRDGVLDSFDLELRQLLSPVPGLPGVNEDRRRVLPGQLP